MLHLEMPVSTVHDGFATIRRPRIGVPRNPPRPPSLASVPENSTKIGFGQCSGSYGTLPSSPVSPTAPVSPFSSLSPVGNRSIPWWELATRKSRYRSCPTLELHVSILFKHLLLTNKLKLINKSSF